VRPSRRLGRRRVREKAWRPLRALLAHWPGGLIVASYDEDFLHAIRLDRRLSLADNAVR
jgi:hypothetical protein